MRISLLRTISGRIALGFFVLLATFGGVSAYSILQMRKLGSALQFIRMAYLEVTLDVAQLNSTQSAMVDQLDGPTKMPPPYVKKSQQYRVQTLEDSIAKLAQLETIFPTYRQTVQLIQGKLQTFLDEYHKNDALFETTFAGDASVETRAATLADLVQREKRLGTLINAYFKHLKGRAIDITKQLEWLEHQVSMWTLALSLAGALIGIVVTVWSVLTLRSLRRLYDGVRSVSGGNYKDRVSISGETEVADLAREFNVMAAAIEERQSELVRSERLAALGKMAAVITHEVRNPLSSIGLNTELLEEELERGGQTEALGLCHTIQKEVDRLTAITEQYLRFARLPRPKLEREQLNHIVADVVEFQREDLRARGVTVELRLAEALPPVAVDEGQLRQALLNLLRNAADAMSAGGGALTVETRLADHDRATEVRVRDTGPGIPAENQLRIFEPFFSTKDGGTGLGLALTQQIVSEHGGRIAVDSMPGEGTTFVITLPAAPPVPSAAPLTSPT